DVADAEQRGDDGMATRLRQHALARIDQYNGEIGRRGAGSHVARILLVAWRVGDDELALGSGEEAVSDVDRDALLALRFQPVDQRREIDVLTCRPMFARIALERGKLILEDQLGVVEKPADQCRLAIVYRSTGEEAQECLVLLLGEIGADILHLGGLGSGHSLFGNIVHDQKYPSRFFFSMEPASSRSIRRPWRSDVRAVSISATIPSSVSASESIAPVSG